MIDSASSAHGIARASVETSDRQWSDVIGVLSASKPALDRPYMADGARELGVSDLLERALGEAALRE